jgi:hypothetical protein
MFGLLRMLLAVALAVSMASVTSATAMACSCVGFTEEEAFDAADVVLVGVVVGRHDPSLGMLFGSTADPVRYTLAVDEVLKGDAGVQVEVATARNGASCGLEMSIGQRWRLYAYRDGGLQVNLCGGSHLLSPDSSAPNAAPGNGPPSALGVLWPLLPGALGAVGAALVAIALRLLGFI